MCGLTISYINTKGKIPPSKRWFLLHCPSELHRRAAPMHQPCRASIESRFTLVKPCTAHQKHSTRCSICVFYVAEHCTIYYTRGKNRKTNRNAKTSGLRGDIHEWKTADNGYSVSQEMSMWCAVAVASYIELLRSHTKHPVLKVHHNCQERLKKSLWLSLCSSVEFPLYASTNN